MIDQDMDFRLLGPLEMLVGGKPVRVTAHRQKIILAMLLIEANQVVPTSRLIEALWGESPPSTPKSQLQITLSALRRLLRACRAPEIIVTRSPGYLIQISENALDVERFEALAARGAANRQPDDAVAQLRASLAVWRGPAFVDIQSRIVQNTAARLNEARLGVLEECLTLELRLGRHREIIGELTELVVDHPLRERFHALLMLALFRSGRQADALEVFRRARETLVEELGLEPGEELRRLEHAILTRDAGIALGQAADTAVHIASAPQQLPATVADFVDRQEIINRAKQILAPAELDEAKPNVPIVAFTGQGGVGKTTLALHLGHLMRDRYPDGQLYAKLGGNDQPKDPAEVLHQFLRSFGVAPVAIPDTVENSSAMYRSLLAERRTLVVLDDAAGLRQVAPLLPGSPGCAVIVASRRQLALPRAGGNGLFEIRPFEEQPAMDMLALLIGPRASTEAPSARALVELCGRLPLALRIAGTKLGARPHWPVDKMVRRLTDEKRMLDELDLEGVSVRATITCSYESLTDEGRRLLLRLGLLGASDFPAWVSAPLLGVDVETAEDVLEGLVDARLVEARVGESGHVRFLLHDLVRVYAVERLIQEVATKDRHAILRRLLCCWLSLVVQAQNRDHGRARDVLHGAAAWWNLPPGTVDRLLTEPSRWCQEEQPLLVEAILQAGQMGEDELCWDLAVTSVSVAAQSLHVDDWRRIYEVALDSVRKAGNRRGEAALLCTRGRLAPHGYPHGPEQDLRRSLEIFEQLGDLDGRALAHGALESRRKALPLSPKADAARAARSRI